MCEKAMVTEIDPARAEHETPGDEQPDPRPAEEPGKTRESGDQVDEKEPADVVFLPHHDLVEARARPAGQRPVATLILAAPGEERQIDARGTVV